MRLTTPPKKVLIVGGLGIGSGTGAATARLFSSAGFAVGLIARRSDVVDQLANELNSAGGDATGFPVPGYSAQDMADVWTAIRAKYTAPKYTIHVAVFNIVYGVFKHFLDITPREFEEVLRVNTETAVSFSREAIIQFKKNEISYPTGARGILIYTGSTSSIKGRPTGSAPSIAKRGLRGLSQSLNMEFGKDNIHVSHCIIDGLIDSGEYVKSKGQDVKESVKLRPESIAKAYLYLVNQDYTAWTWELDLRHAHWVW
jgi:NAD(P)-dependent dehydrogenase (short-subunit alcohol dehydrogenase family)